jgi:hypothetical protein
VAVALSLPVGGLAGPAAMHTHSSSSTPFCQTGSLILCTAEQAPVNSKHC